MRRAHPIGPSGLPAFSATYAYPARRDHDHARLVHRVRVALNQMHCGGLLRNRHEANDAGMRQAAHKHQLAEILASVMSIRCSASARASSSSSVARGAASKADRSWPRPASARMLRDAAHASRRNLKTCGRARARGHPHRRLSGGQRAGTPGCPPVPRVFVEDRLGGITCRQHSETCSTAMRMSRMIGLPPKTSARTVMRSSSSG